MSETQTVHLGTQPETQHYNIGVHDRRYNKENFEPQRNRKKNETLHSRNSKVLHNTTRKPLFPVNTALQICTALGAKNLPESSVIIPVVEQRVETLKKVTS